MKVTFHVGKAGKNLNQHHNRRDEKEKEWNKDGHIDRTLTSQNKTLIDYDLHRYCEALFRKPVEAFNEKNRIKHPERLKELQSVCKDAESKAREIIIQVGNKDAQLSQEQYEAFFREALTSFELNNPTLKVFGAYIHFDESTPHLHLDFMPLTLSDRGMSLRASLEGALKDIGYKDSGKYNDRAFIQWSLDMREHLENLAEPYIEAAGHHLEPYEVSSKSHCTEHREFYEYKLKELEKKGNQTKLKLDVLEEKLKFYGVNLESLQQDFQRHLITEVDDDFER